MKIYLAAPYFEKQRMREWQRKLEAAGHGCTSNWIHGDEGMTLDEAAQRNLDDIDAADAVVSLTLPNGTMFISGGRHVEFGYGLARGKLMIIVTDEAENIFHNLTTIASCTTIEGVVDYLS
jgi:nucleoside 2-deoxyribosyltransferase